MNGGAWWAAVHGVTRSQTRLSDFTFTFHFHALEKEMAIHSSVLAWRIPGTGEPGGLPSLGSHRVGHDWSNLAAAAAAFNDDEIFNCNTFFNCEEIKMHKLKEIIFNLQLIAQFFELLRLFLLICQNLDKAKFCCYRVYFQNICLFKKLNINWVYWKLKMVWFDKL